MSEPLKKLVVELTTLTYGGECMGRLEDGRAVFVPYALPGEQVEIELVEEKRGYARGRIVKLLRSSPSRIEPRCAHFGVCGGCHYQHLTYADQLLAKHAILCDQLKRIAGIQNPDVDDVVPSPQTWQYRNAMQFHLNEEGKVGFRAWGGSRIVPIHECHLPQEPIQQLWPQFDFEPSTFEERVEVRAGSGDELLVVLESENPEPPEFSVDIPLSAVRIGPSGRFILAGDDYLVMDVLEKPLKVSAGSFFQVNTPQAEAMLRHLQQVLPLTKETVLLDLYSGVGLFSRFFAGQVARTIAIELSPSACDDYAVNLDEFENIELYVGAAEHILPHLEVQGGVAIVDPPRAGLDRQALDALVQVAPECIAYVSCDPSTLARDLKRLLAAGYHVERVTPFDMFPQTFHVETVVLMSRVKE